MRPLAQSMGPRIWTRSCWPLPRLKKRRSGERSGRDFRSPRLRRVTFPQLAAQRRSTSATPSWLILKPCSRSCAAITRSDRPWFRCARIVRIAFCSAGSSTSAPSSPSQKPNGRLAAKIAGCGRSGRPKRSGLWAKFGNGRRSPQCERRQMPSPLHKAKSNWTFATNPLSRKGRGSVRLGKYWCPLNALHGIIIRVSGV